MTMRFGDAIIRVMISTPNRVRKQVTYWLLVCEPFGCGEIPGYFCLISYIWSLKLCDLSNSNLQIFQNVKSTVHVNKINLVLCFN